MTRLAGWGRYPVAESALVTVRSELELADATRKTAGVISRGLGRSYGDAAIGAATSLSTLQLNRFRAFDAATGLLTVEGGVSLAEIISALMPSGFFPAVVPGTRFVTVGGAIASDVHGKNHHRHGGFGDHVTEIKLATAAGDVLTLGADQNKDLFLATIGGMGLTGSILEATFRLRPIENGWIRQRTIVAENLAATIAAIEENDQSTYSVAWIDCLAKGSHLGRSLVYLGEHVAGDELGANHKSNRTPAIAQSRLGVPFDFPSFALNHWSVDVFNELYFRMGARKAGKPFLIKADPYFFPLDTIGNWNRIYGRRGFVQHQSVIPLKTAESVISELLDRISRRGDASFLAVLKKLGASNGLLSFPMPGYTLALDFPVSSGLFEFLDELDKIVIAAGGRLYLAKDSRQSRETFEASYPNAEKFRDIRRTVDPERRLQSFMARRLGL